MVDDIFLEFGLGGHNEEDSKQAAEAMVQLSGVGFYNQQGTFPLVFDSFLFA